MKLGIHLVVGLVLCKLVLDKLFEAEVEVVVLKAPLKQVCLEALVQKAVLAAHFSMTMIVSTQS